MPYIGKNPVGGGFHKLDNLTASATDTYALTLGSAAYYPESANQLLVSLNGVIQAPQDSFTVSGSDLVFDSALTASDSIDFVVALGDVLAVKTVTDGAITTAKLGSGAVTDAKIDTMAASKLTGALPAIDGSSLTGVLDYASGTFTPAFTAQTSDPTISYDFREGYYQRIGDYCYFSLRMGTGSKSGGSGDLYISGLPYTAASSNHHGGAVALNYTWGNNYNPLVWYISSSQNFLRLTRNDNAGTPLNTGNMVTGSGNRIWISGFYQITT